ncbi:MAG: hypothetical protein SGI90_08540 [Candidatus Eisenbacteria bacterium]|nr:hypothetical protein [Candidatus Eisenbacteria bacterium]
MESSRQLFVDMKDDTRRLCPSYVFMMRCLLYSRLETGNETGTDVADEDVNVYLAHLLQSFSDPEYVESARPYLHRYDHEVFKRLERSTDARLKYVIYKTNADFLLVSIGVFDNPGQWLAHRLPQVQAPKNRAGEPTEEASMGRGKTYYHFAWSYSQQVNRGHPGITEVLEKLSVGFDRYIRVLSHMRGEYLDLMKALSTGEIYHLERNVNKEQERQDLKQGQDAFLDSWLAWRRTGTPESLEEVRRSAAVIRALDPDFHFNEDDNALDLPVIQAPGKSRAAGSRVRQRKL